MSPLPKDVVQFRQIVLQSPEHPYQPIVRKLIVNNPELVSMWRTVERRSRKTDPWVGIFISQVHDAARPPAYVLKNRTERRELCERIGKLTAELARALSANDLDAQLIFSDSSNFPGFRFYEDFGESNRARIDDLELEKLSFVRLLSAIAERSERLVEEAEKPGKSGKNSRAVRFARTLTIDNSIRLKGPLYAVTAAATNALFGTTYSKSDVRKLIKRFDLQHPLGWTF